MNALADYLNQYRQMLGMGGRGSMSADPLTNQRNQYNDSANALNNAGYMMTLDQMAQAPGLEADARRYTREREGAATAEDARRYNAKMELLRSIFSGASGWGNADLPPGPPQMQQPTAPRNDVFGNMPQNALRRFMGR